MSQAAKTQRGKGGTKGTINERMKDKPIIYRRRKCHGEEYNVEHIHCTWQDKKRPSAHKQQRPGSTTPYRTQDTG